MGIPVLADSDVALEDDQQQAPKVPVVDDSDVALEDEASRPAPKAVAPQPEASQTAAPLPAGAVGPLPGVPGVPQPNMVVPSIGKTLAGPKPQAQTPQPQAQPVAPKPPDQSQTMAVPNPKGLVEPGNLPIWNRPTVQNADGSHSTEYSTSFEDEQGNEVLVPTIVNGKFLTKDGTKPPEGSPEEKAMFKAAWQHYLQTGENLGKFKDADSADAYADALSNRGDAKQQGGPAGAVGPLPGIPGPQPQMTIPSVGQTLTGINPKTATPVTGDSGAGESTDQALEGLKQFGKAWGDDFSFNSKGAKQGLTKMVNGVMGAAGSTIVGGSGAGLLDAPGVSGLLGRAGPQAARALAAAILGGYVTGNVARWGVKELGLDPDSQDLAEALGNIAGGTAAAHVSGVVGAGRESPETVPPENLHPDYHQVPELDPGDVDEEATGDKPKEPSAGETKGPPAETKPAKTETAKAKPETKPEKSETPEASTSLTAKETEQPEQPSTEETKEEAKPVEVAKNEAPPPPGGLTGAEAEESSPYTNAAKPQKPEAGGTVSAPKGEILPPEKTQQITKGDTVTLEDGRKATVDFVDNKITRRARVTTDDGEKIQSIPTKSLRLLPAPKGETSEEQPSAANLHEGQESALAPTNAAPAEKPAAANSPSAAALTAGQPNDEQPNGPAGGNGEAAAGGRAAVRSEPAASEKQEELVPGKVERKPLYEMSLDELDAAHREASGRDNADLLDLFGAEGAKRYQQLQRNANSTANPEKADAASAEIEKMEAALTEAQRNRLFGIGDTRHQAEDIEEFRRGLRQVDASGPDALSQSLKYAASRLGDPSAPPEEMTREQQVAMAQFRHAFEIAKESGWDTNTVIRQAIRYAGDRFHDPNDARHMLEQIARSVEPTKGPSNRIGSSGKEKVTNALQEPSASGVLQRQPEEAGSAGGGRGGVEPSQQGQGATEKSSQSQKELVQKPVEKAPTLREHFLGEMRAGRMPSDNNGLRKMVADYHGKQPAEIDNVKLKEAQEDFEGALAQHASELVANDKEPRKGFDKLVDLYKKQPNLNIRTSTSIANQAYSTPAPLAYIAGKLAGVDSKTSVYEPTAGTGMLVLTAKPENVHANELNDLRAGILKSRGFHVTKGDALTADVKPKSKDVVLANPPFGSVKDEGGKATKQLVDNYKIGQIDHLIAAKALEAMKDDGRATLILSANKVPGGLSTDDRIFFNWLYSHYNVVGHFEVDGDLYSRQGAGWPVRVIEIDGRVRSDKFSPVEGAIKRVKTWDGVYGEYERLAARDRGASEVGPVGSLESKAGENGQGQISGGATGQAEGGNQPEPRAGATVPDRQPGASAEPLHDSDLQLAPGLASTDSDVRPDADVAESDKLPAGKTENSLESKGTAGPAGIDRTNLDPENEFQSPYVPASSKKDKDVLVPTNMRDPLQGALKSLIDKVGSLDKYVQKELGYGSVEDLHHALMGLQIDSVAAAIYQIKHGAAIIISDQTGIGKGRQAAAIIRWAVRQGHIPIFMSVNPSLFTDMYGDLADIGTTDVKPFIVNSDESIQLPNGTKAFANNKGTHTATLERIRATGQLPEGRNAVFLTYSQINQANRQQGVLSALKSKAVLVLDESHNAAGASQTGEFMLDMVKSAKGVVYLSATYAKRPDNMPLYMRTDMGKAIGNADSLADAMSRGGLALQTVISNNLVKSMQHFRRERSFAGINIATKIDTANRVPHEKIADAATEVLRAIVKADKGFHLRYVAHANAEARKSGKAVVGAGNKTSAGVDHTQFTAVVHNVVRQILLGLKADTAAKEAIAQIKAGNKPVIFVESTMGSFLANHVQENGISMGEPLGKFDYRIVLKQALDRTRAITVTDPYGNKNKKVVHVEDMDSQSQLDYRKAEDLIKKLDIDIPLSPIDWMRQQIINAGYSVAEITGRDLAVDYSGSKPKLAQVDPAEQNNKVLTVRKFNDGRLDSLILNVAGSTGISLHASERYKDQRPRHMIVAQPAQDINIFMQALGRVNRTGQVKKPGYTLLNVDLPAEKRPTALLSGKMKSLNANTSSNTESSTSIKTPDILNKYGDQVVKRYLEENRGLADLLDVDLDEPDLARKTTGRLALLPVKIQKAFYADVETQYTALIDYLDSTNTNDLAPKTIDYQAKPIKSSVIYEGTDKNNPFGGDAEYNEFSVKAQHKPVNAEEVDAKVKETLDGKTGREFARDLIAKLDSQLDAYKKTLDPEASTEGIDAVAEHARSFLRGVRVGDTFTVTAGGDEFDAAIVNVQSTHKGAGNPYSLSKLSFTLMTTGEHPRIKIPGTQLKESIVKRLQETPMQLFEMHRPPARSTAKIITGNLLGAYSQISGNGTIINFTREDGSVEQGILLPKRFNLEEDTKGEYQMRSPEQVSAFLDKAKEAYEVGVGVYTQDGQLRIMRYGEGYKFIAPKAKATGGKYFLDKALTAVVGDFTSTGQSMVAQTNSKKAAEAIRLLMGRGTALYVPKSVADVAKKFASGPQEMAALAPRPKYGVFNRDGKLISEPYSTPEKAAKDVRHTGNNYIDKIVPEKSSGIEAIRKAMRQVERSPGDVDRGNYVAVEDLRKAGVSDADILKAADAGKLILGRYDGPVDGSEDLSRYLHNPGTKIYYIGVALPLEQAIAVGPKAAVPRSTTVSQPWPGWDKVETSNEYSLRTPAQNFADAETFLLKPEGNNSGALILNAAGRDAIANTYIGGSKMWAARALNSAAAERLVGRLTELADTSTNPLRRQIQKMIEDIRKAQDHDGTIVISGTRNLTTLAEEWSHIWEFRSGVAADRDLMHRIADHSLTKSVLTRLHDLGYDMSPYNVGMEILAKAMSGTLERDFGVPTADVDSFLRAAFHDVEDNHPGALDGLPTLPERIESIAREVHDAGTAADGARTPGGSRPGEHSLATNGERGVLEKRGLEEAKEMAFLNPVERFKDWALERSTPETNQKEMMRDTRGRMDRQIAAAAEKLKADRNRWALRSRTDATRFINAIETDQIGKLPAKDQPLATFLHDNFYAPIIKEIQAARPGVLETLIEHYFARWWKNPASAAKIIKSVLSGKRPFAGRASFLKQRTVPTFVDGLHMGLEPQSWNPVDISLHKYAEMGQFLMGYKTLNMMKDAGTAKFVRWNAKQPDGWQKLNDRIGEVKHLNDAGEMVLDGHYWAPPGAAKVFNNYVSQGLSGNSTIYDTLMAMNNNMNALQLGISAYHATLTGLLAPISDLAIGFRQLSEGKPIKAGISIARGISTVPSLVNTVVNGRHLLKEYLSPGSYRKMAAEANALAAAGGGVSGNNLDIPPILKLMNAIRNGDVPEALSTIPGTILSTAVWPIMNKWVPWMKFGAAYSMIHDTLDEAGRKGWTFEQTRRQVQADWDSADNRYGQVKYDNKFWPKWLKDSLHLGMRAVGFTHGSVDEGGGGMSDILREAGKIPRGEMPKITNRMGFIFGLGTYAAMMGGLLYYLWNKKRPEKLEDYYYPTLYGVRMSMPTYMRFYTGLAHDPKQAILNTVSPIVEAFTEIAENKDFYGTEIRHKDDPAVDQFIQFGKWAAKFMEPFSFGSSEKMLQTQGEDVDFDEKHPWQSIKGYAGAIARHPGLFALGQLGFQPAPAYVQHSPALNLAYEYTRANAPPGTKTQEQADKQRAMGILETMHRNNQSAENIKRAEDHFINAGMITEEDADKAEMYADSMPLETVMNIPLREGGLTLEQALHVYEKATPGERELISDAIDKKTRQLEDAPEAQREKLDKLYTKVMGAHP